MASALQTQFGSKASQYGQEYGQAKQQAQNAYGNLDNFSKNMQSGTDMYAQQLQSANANAGYNPAQLQAAQNQVSQIQGILGGLPRAVQAQNANYGATAGDVAGQYATTGANLNQTLNLANTNAANEITKMQGGLSGAQAGTTAGLQGQQNQLEGLKQTYSAAQAQMDTAQKQQQFFSDLYAKQGYLDAQQAAAYAQAKQAEASAGLLAQQAAETAQKIKFNQNQFDLNQARTQATPQALNASQSYLNSQGANGKNWTSQDAAALSNYTTPQTNYDRVMKSSNPLQAIPSLLSLMFTGQ